MDKSGIIVVRTRHVSFRMAAPNIHHSVRKSTSCMCHMALQWLRVNGFGMIKDDLWIPDMTVSYSQNWHNVTIFQLSCPAGTGWHKGHQPEKKTSRKESMCPTVQPSQKLPLVQQERFAFQGVNVTCTAASSRVFYLERWLCLISGSAREAPMAK